MILTHEADVLMHKRAESLLLKGSGTLDFVDEVNKQLEKMGYNIGSRLIEDFLARSGMGRCSDFREVGEVIAKVCLSISPNLKSTCI